MGDGKLDKLEDGRRDFREEIEEREELDEREALKLIAPPRGRKRSPNRSLRLSTISKVRLCVEILATNKTQRVLAREHGCTRQAVSYYVRALIPQRRRIKPAILFKQGDLNLLY